jgi:nucleotide-binding universal stress UspA family protein
MSFARKTVIAVDLSTPSLEHLKVLRQLDFLRHGEVHFVFVFQTAIQIYGIGFGEVALAYPNNEDRAILEKSALATLVKKSKECLPAGSEAKVYQHCLFSDSPKDEFCKFSANLPADTLVIFGREKHGFFDSSFAQYVLRHSKANLIVLKG